MTLVVVRQKLPKAAKTSGQHAGPVGPLVGPGHALTQQLLQCIQKFRAV